MQDQKSLRALLIGINGYKAVTSLNGCINDALAVGDYFQSLCAKQEPPIRWEPVYLLAPANAEEETRIREKGIEFQAPTRQNIIDGFTHFDAADPERGDFCLFYYSGHGSYTRAPEVFRDYEPSGRLQTIVCADSRVNETRDLLDKELGYLLAKALEGKAPIEKGAGKRPGVHFLAITDSCYSGTNTRGDQQGPTARMTSPKNQNLGEADILGFTRGGNCFYEPFAPGQERVKRYGGLKHARYIKLAAAQDAEKALETNVTIPQAGDKPPLQLCQGIFTYSMLATLNQSGAKLSYGELMQRVQLEVTGRASEQVPMLDNTDLRDDELFFLRNAFHTPSPDYEVYFRLQPQPEWILNAGAIQGIVPASADQKTRIRLAGTPDRTVDVVEVRATESVLDPGAFTAADAPNRLLRATIAEMAFPAIPVGFGPDLLGQDETIAGSRANIRAELKRRQPKYIAWLDQKPGAELEINLVKNRDGSLNYILTRPGSRVPLFERHSNAYVFWGDVEKVARYQNVVRMSNPATEIPRNDFRVEVQVMEGKPFGRDTLNTVFDAKALPAENYRRLTDPDSIDTRFWRIGGKDVQPALKVKIEAAQFLETAYWVGALYCDNQFGISSKLLPVQRIGKNGAPFVNMEFRATVAGQPRKWDAIPVTIDSGWRRLGVTEITDYLILFISNAKTPFDLGKYDQTPIELDATRAAGFAPEEDLERDDWFTIKIPVNITFPVPEQRVISGRPEKFNGFTLQAPAGFSAVVQPTNLANARRRVQQYRDAELVFDEKIMLPPGELWTGLEGGEEVFAYSPVVGTGRQLGILELTAIAGALSEQAPLEIIPKDPLRPGETIVPFAYSEVSGHYYPIGFTTEEGTVRITQLPAPNMGIIGADGVAAVHGEGGSVKLFFQKVRGKARGKVLEFDGLGWG